MNTNMKFPIKKRYLFPLIFVGGYLLGPQPDYPDYNGNIEPLSFSLFEIDDFIVEKEAKVESVEERGSPIAAISVGGT